MTHIKEQVNAVEMMKILEAERDEWKEVAESYRWNLMSAERRISELNEDVARLRTALQEYDGMENV